jgi:hypothetical protein
MKLTGQEIATILKDDIQKNIGRHLYGVLGNYAQLDKFESEILSQLKSSFNQSENSSSCTIINLNFALMDHIGDADLRNLVKNEGKRPQAIQRKLNQTFDALLADLLEKDHFIVLKQIELLFAYNLDLQTIRARASNQNHILLMLPGEKLGDHVVLFTESNSRFHRELPFQLIADNHLWELENANDA